MSVDDENDGMLQILYGKIMDTNLAILSELSGNTVSRTHQHFQAAILCHFPSFLPEFMLSKSVEKALPKNFLCTPILARFFYFAMVFSKNFLASKNFFMFSIAFTFRE
jgi:hypothetical protein